MHGKISDLKKGAADRMGHAVSQLMSLQREAKVMQRSMMRQLNHFKQKVQSMEGTESNQDASLIDEMTNQLNKLQMTHEKTMDWKRKNKHITAAWRNEVNAQLQNLHVSMGSDADAIKNAQVGEEMDLNKDMQEMQMRIEDEYAGNQVGAAGVFSKMVDGTLSKMNNMLGDQAMLDANSASESKGAEYQMESNDKMVNKELGGIDENSEELNTKAMQLKTDMTAALQNIHGMMLLPQLTASQKNQAAEKSMGNLQTSLNKIAASTGTSLLQEGAMNKLEDSLRKIATEASTSGSSFIQTDGAAQLTDQQALAAEKAVEQLNSQLEGENAKMRRENDRLQAGIDSVKKSHHLG